MKNLFFIFLLLFVLGCNKTKTVFICGDHVCVNKAEAQQYFEDNLSLEVKVVDKDKSNNIDLVELNLKSNEKDDKQIVLLNKKKTKKNVRKLSNSEIAKKKDEVKKRQKATSKKLRKINKKEKALKSKNTKVKKTKKRTSKIQKESFDVCTILNKCSIDEISDYLIKQGNVKKFPDITIRE